jgi:hypothetical protein
MSQRYLRRKLRQQEHIMPLLSIDSQRCECPFKSLVQVSSLQSRIKGYAVHAERGLEWRQVCWPKSSRIKG